ncbi:hypothetical protein GUA87_01630 [Sneathiella sp. P13V-1]|uniref:hypothetical protein n=1 Tax=Sneathiella sp. P13V-1 TaxID=2697366 RepID=UPI00187B556D|nr:hypothetical protein [Sneathiella sp. P13V-1]MBE7635528.1 hypothetical protein [Sneathiella sp. P13V-1]
MKKRILTPVIVASMTAMLAMPVQAQDDKGAGDLAVEGISKLMDALRLFVDNIPQYETPEILENGDIIIRKKKKMDDEDKDGKTEETST